MKVTITGTNSLLDGESGKLVGYYDNEETQAKVFISGTLWKLSRTNLIFPQAQANLPEVEPLTIPGSPEPLPPFTLDGGSMDKETRHQGSLF